MRFTKGPWLAAATSVYPDREPRGFEIKIQRPIEDSISLEEAQANSHLVAAAPDMYELLDKINAAFYTRTSRKEWLALMEMTKPLLNKARGES